MHCFWLTLMSKLYCHQSESGRQELRTSVTKYLGGSDQWLSQSSVLRHGHSLTPYLYRTLVNDLFLTDSNSIGHHQVITTTHARLLHVWFTSKSHRYDPSNVPTVNDSLCLVCVCDRLVCLSEGDAVSCGKKTMCQCHVRRASNTCHYERRRGHVELGGPKPVLLIGTQLMYHLHSAPFAREGPSGPHLIWNYLTMWPIVEGVWSYQVLMESV